MAPYQLVPRLLRMLDIAWGFTESDFVTFVVPDMAFGFLGALAPTALVDDGGNRPSTQLIHMPGRVLALLAFNWSNLVIFDLANQRSPESVAEDKINKPWRPIPMGKITMQQTRWTLLVTVPLVLWLNYYLGVWERSAVIHLVTWMYNDLRGGDEVILRELLIAVGYGMFNAGSLEIAGCRQAGAGTSSPCRLNGRGIAWTSIISAVIFTTMQIQDLKDQEGDKSRGRKTVALAFGCLASRVSIALFVLVWSAACVGFWGAGVLSFCGIISLGMTIAWRVLRMRNCKADAFTWRLWCWWLVALYALPTVR